MRLAMDFNPRTGWGTCGHHLSKGLNKLPALPHDIVVHAAMVTMDSAFPQEWDRANIGYCFFETPVLLKEYAGGAKKWDCMVFGSRWCEEWARTYGIENCTTIRQGVDASLFYPGARSANKRFVIGSFGKFELRKGQDIVLRALQVINKHCPEIDWELHAGWYNPWLESMRPMTEVAPLILATDPMTTIKSAVAYYGLPMERVVLHPQLEHKFTPNLYRECDVAVFPNRAEGGCNLCLMEAMACGVPVIAVNAHSHAEVLQEGGFLPISCTDGMQEGWVEPSAEDLAEMIMSVWENRDHAAHRAEVALNNIRQFTWSRMANDFWELAKNYAG